MDVLAKPRDDLKAVTRRLDVVELAQASTSHDSKIIGIPAEVIPRRLAEPLGMGARAGRCYGRDLWSGHATASLARPLDTSYAGCCSCECRNHGPSAAASDGVVQEGTTDCSQSCRAPVTYQVSTKHAYVRRQTHASFADELDVTCILWVNPLSHAFHWFTQ